ncbi:hypothetical protein Q1695_003960 [Nippostrongylus brasiliensis]|nr:hypothetical protein Q1695_003960 [Nippostrongylus brasiliensis]
MGSAGIAIGPDGKPLKRQEKRSQPAQRGFVPKQGRGAMGGGRPMQPGPMMNPRFGRPMPGPYGMGGGFGGRGPMPFGPGGNMGYGPGPVPPPGPGANVSFFNGPPMGDARTGPMQSGQQVTPSAATVGRGAVGGGAGAAGTEANTNTGSEVPGFGTNSSIHELFGKMVWKKMEGLRDEAVIDRLQNRIMNMIHEALAQQNNAPGGGAVQGQGGAMNGQNGGGFRAF